MLKDQLKAILRIFDQLHQERQPAIKRTAKADEELQEDERAFSAFQIGQPPASWQRVAGATRRPSKQVSPSSARQRTTSRP